MATNYGIQFSWTFDRCHKPLQLLLTCTNSFGSSNPFTNFKAFKFYFEDLHLLRETVVKIVTKNFERVIFDMFCAQN